MTQEEKEKFNDGWISVGDRLPEEGQKILVYRGDLENPRQEADIADSNFFMYYDWNSITHWRPLPPPPIK